MAEAIAKNNQYAVEYRIRHRSGKTVWVLDQGSINETADADEKGLMVYW